MVADAYDAVSALDGVHSARIVLDDHFASDAINDGVAARAGFVRSFAGRPPPNSTSCGSISCARRSWPAPISCAGHWPPPARTPDDLAALTLGDVPPSPALTGCANAAPSLGCRPATTRRC